jgi:hypothetical protein
VSFTYHGHYNKHVEADCSTERCVHWIE